MGILSRIFGGSKAAPGAVEAPTPECGHVTLVPRWDSAEDMGKTDKITHYTCEGCNQTISPEEAERIRIDAGA